MKNLPKGATAIDYAYLIHTDIGNKMVMAKVSLEIISNYLTTSKELWPPLTSLTRSKFFQVNGNHVKPTHVLANAEVVEIITSDVSLHFLITLLSFTLLTIIQFDNLLYDYFSLVLLFSQASTSASVYKQHMEWLDHKHVKTRCAQHKIKKVSFKYPSM